MGIEVKLTDRELPASPAFVRFLAQVLSRTAIEDQSWPDQVSEELTHDDPAQRRMTLEAAEQVMRNGRGRELVARAYSLFMALLTGDLEPLAAFHSRFHFVIVTGIPRTGGSYLTAEIYRSLDMPPHQVPNTLAHDSFPEAGPFELSPWSNSWTATLKTTAEYLTMVESFFAGHRPRMGKIVVPKKLTQGVYAAGLFRQVFGPEADWILTVRHPVPACVSTYEKSGGLPDAGRFAVRSNIEAWCRRDLERGAYSSQQLEGADYFDVYLRYWEQYYMLVTTNGLSQCPRLRVVAFGADPLRSVAQLYQDLHGSGLRASEFHVSYDARRRHSDWVARARPAIERVAAAWREAGLAFPLGESSAAL